MYRLPLPSTQRPSRSHWSTVNVPEIYSNIEHRNSTLIKVSFQKFRSKRLEPVEKWMEYFSENTKSRHLLQVPVYKRSACRYSQRLEKCEQTTREEGRNKARKSPFKCVWSSWTQLIVSRVRSQAREMWKKKKRVPLKSALFKDDDLQKDESHQGITVQPKPSHLRGFLKSYAGNRSYPSLQGRS